MGLVGKTALDFELEGYFNDSFNDYTLSDYRGKWVILLFYPLDFTFVWPTKVLNFSDTANELGKNQLWKWGYENHEVDGMCYFSLCNSSWWEFWPQGSRGT